MKSFFLFVLLIGAPIMTPHNVSSSAPQKIEGPDSCRQYKGVVASAGVVKKTIGTSDVSAEERSFLEILLTVEEARTIEFPEVDPPLRAPKNKTGEGEVKTVVKENPELKGTTVRFYFSPGEGIAVGDRLEITTRTRSSISRGWISGEHGATYKKVKKDQK
jgi:hypothetical protein